LDELSEDKNSKNIIEAFKGEIIELHELLSKTWKRKQSEGE
jgi:hypothetical protein